MGASDETRSVLLEAVRALEPQVRASGDQIERDRQLPRPLVDAMASAGLFKIAVPAALGGGEADPETQVRVIEEVSRADGSAGWCVMIPIQLGILAGYLPEATAVEIFGRDPGAYVAGVVAPAGRAVRVDGGYRATGRWRYASGCRHATWVLGTSIVHDGDAPHLGADGKPERRWLLFPAAECRIIDTWHVSGLRGTGSHDFAVEDVFVPREHTLPPGIAGVPGVEVAPVHRGALYAFGITQVPITFAAVSLGIARGALDAFTELVGGPAGAKAHLRENPLVQAQLGEAEARLRAARAFLYEAVREAWATTLGIGQPTTEQRILARLAYKQAAAVSAEVVEALWYAAGASAVFESNPLERRFRDAHAAAQRPSATTYAEAGRMLLGPAAHAPGS